MKKVIIIILGILGILGGIIILDTLQALVFNNSPFIHKREYTCRNKEDYYIDRGLLVNHYYCSNINETLFKNTKSDCLVCYEE